MIGRCTALRERQKRNFIATMMLNRTHGMLLAATSSPFAERKQQRLCSGQRTTWLNCWLGITSQGRSLREFTRKLIATEGRSYPLPQQVVVGRLRRADVKDVLG